VSSGGGSSPVDLELPGRRLDQRRDLSPLGQLDEESGRATDMEGTDMEEMEENDDMKHDDMKHDDMKHAR
jgi:hypothetical protein